MIKGTRLVFAFALLGCSSSSDDDGKTKVNKANPCATPGATYLQMTTKIDGTCPDIPDQIVNIGNDGTIPGEISCDKVEQDGCRAHNTNCVSGADECSASSTFTTTFEEDGSSAAGLVTMTIDCKDGSSCIGTYRTEMIRQ